MIGTIPNPKKAFQIERPVTEVKQAIEHLPLFTAKYKLFKANPTLNQYTFETSEFLSAGVYIDINYFTINDLRAEVVIEIKRKIGAFDQRHEVSLANEHLTNLTDLISQSISTDPSERSSKFEKIEAEKKQKEEALNAKIEENKRKAQEEKENNPFLYYFKHTVVILLSIGLLGGTLYLMYKTFT